MTDPGESSQGSGDDRPRAFDPADAFSLLGDATRLEIVTALHDSSLDPPVQFISLYEHVDADDTGRFNYHLDELVPQFVSKTDDGYELSAAGERVARAIAAGTYAGAPRREPFAMDGACYDCGTEALRGAYEDERFRIECRGCGQTVLDIAVPPSVLRDRDPVAFVDAVEKWAMGQVDQARRGICPDCGGVVGTAVAPNGRESVDVDVVARFECAVCGRDAVTSFGVLAARASTVEAFHRERDRPLRERRYWEIPQCMTDEQTTVRSRDPWRVRVTFRAAGDACHVEFGGDLQVRETTVVPGDERGPGAPD